LRGLWARPRRPTPAPNAGAGGSRSRAEDPEPSRRVLRPLLGLSRPQPLKGSIVMAGKSLKNTKSLDNLKEAFADVKEVV
jgi:hypothetical protein